MSALALALGIQLAVLAPVLTVEPASAASRSAAQVWKPEPPQPVVRKNQLVDARTGIRWVPRGANWPDLEYSCVQGWSAAQHHSASEVAAMVSWGFNVVRLPLNQDCWLGTDRANAGSSMAGYRRQVAQRVQLAQQGGLAVILDLHWAAPAGKLATNGQRAMPDNQSAAFWRSVATTFKSNKSVMFDLYNEPFSPAALWNGRPGATVTDWKCWRDGGCQVTDLTELEGTLLRPTTPTYTAVGMATLVSAVRSTGARQPLILSGMEYANDLTQWVKHKPRDPLNQLVAGWHNYQHQSCPRSCWTTMVSHVKGSAPVVMTETGYSRDGTDPEWLREILDFGAQSGVGYMPWAWWRLNNSDHQTKRHEALLAPGGSFLPQAPVGTTLRTALRKHVGTGSTLAPMATSRPRVTGKARVGRKLVATVGTWSNGTTKRYRWYRNGKAIKGATKPKYVVKRADKRNRVLVKVVVSKPGYKPITLASKAHKIR